MARLELRVRTCPGSQEEASPAHLTCILNVFDGHLRQQSSDAKQPLLKRINWRPKVQ